MSVTLAVTGFPTTALSGDVVVTTVVVGVTSGDSTDYSKAVYQAHGGDANNLSGPIEVVGVDYVDCADFVTYESATNSNAGVYVEFSQPPKKGKTYTFHVRYKIKSSAYGIVSLNSLFYAIKYAPGTQNSVAYSNTTDNHICSVSYPNGPQGIPYKPTGLAVTAEDQTSITLSWTDPNSGLSSTSIYMSTDGVAFSSNTSFAKGNTSGVIHGLLPSTQYWFKITAVNDLLGLESDFSDVVDDTTDAPPPPPTVQAINVAAEALSSDSISVTWSNDAAALAATDELGWRIRRAIITGGPYTTVASVPTNTGSGNANDYEWTDKTVAAESTYYYVVVPFGIGGDGTVSAEVSATTPQSNITVALDLGFTFTPGARTKIIQVAGRVEFWSDLDRPVVRINRRTYKMGLKPQLEAPDVDPGGSGDLTGTFVAYIMLLRSDGLTPSMPSPASAEITVSGGRITITPEADPDDASKIHVRDHGYNTDGTEIPGCDTYKVFLWDKSTSNVSWVATLPITTLTYTTDTDLTATELASPSRETMPINFQNLIPPACGYAEYNPSISRQLAFGERVMRPSDDEIANGASVTITNGAHSCTVSADWVNVDLDALYHKELYLNKAGTSWFVVDVNGTTLTLRNPDEKKDEAGFQGITGEYFDFAFASPSRVYLSAFFSNGIGGPAQFQPETFPPRYLEAELNPDDNQDPNGVIASRDVMFLTKPGSDFFTTGGAATDEDDASGDNLPQVVNVSRGSGLLAPKTLCRDRFDVVYGLNDQGPFSLRQSGVQKIGTMAGCAWLLQSFYDVSSAAGAVGSWFIREDYFLMCGLNRKGNFGARDWCIYDSRNNAILPQDFPARITALEQTNTDNNDYQMLYGDENGNVGVLLTQDVYVDNTNYTLTDPTSQEIPISLEIISGDIAPEYGFSPTCLRPHFKIDGMTDPLVVTIEYDARRRSGDASDFVATKSRTFSVSTTKNPDNVPLKRRQCQSVRFRLAFDAPRDSQVRIPNLEVEAVESSIGN